MGAPEIAPLGEVKLDKKFIVHADDPFSFSQTFTTSQKVVILAKAGIQTRRN
jgi:hypothetical protein